MSVLGAKNRAKKSCSNLAPGTPFQKAIPTGRVNKLITDNGATLIDVLIVLIGLALFTYVILRVMFSVLIGARNAWRTVHHPDTQESKIHK